MLVILKTSLAKKISLRELGQLVEYVDKFMEREIKQAEFVFNHEISTNENVASIQRKFEQILQLNLLSNVLTSLLSKEKANTFLDDNLSLLVYEQLLKESHLKAFHDCRALTEKYNMELQNLRDAEASNTVKRYIEEVCEPAAQSFREKIANIAKDIKRKEEKLNSKYKKLLDKRCINLDKVMSEFDWCELQSYEDGTSLEFKEVKGLSIIDALAADTEPSPLLIVEEI